MTKRTIAKNSSHWENQEGLTVRVGYGVLVLSFISIAISLIPSVSIYAAPLFSQYNYTLLLVMYVFAATGGPLAGYLVGSEKARKAPLLTRRYAGVLFGIVGAWLWLALSMYATVIRQAVFTETSFQDAMLSVAPATVAAAIIVILGIMYVKDTEHKTLLIDYKPYRIVLGGSVIALILSFAVMSLVSFQFGGDILMTLLIYLVVPLLVALVSTLVGYQILSGKSGTPAERVVHSVVAAGFAVVTAFAFGQISNYFLQLQPLIIWVGFATSFLVWGVYLHLMRRACHCD